MHDTICETTKLASSIDNICKFEIDDLIFMDLHWVFNGSFSYDSNEINFRKNVKCFQLVQQRGSVFSTPYMRFKCQSAKLALYAQIPDANLQLEYDGDSDVRDIVMLVTL